MVLMHERKNNLYSQDISCQLELEVSLFGVFHIQQEFDTIAMLMERYWRKAVT